jgi:hypothetical protein
MQSWDTLKSRDSFLERGNMAHGYHTELWQRSEVPK